MYQRFGAYARDARVRRRVSLEVVAQALGFSAVYISDIERGNRRPLTNDKLTVWANAIGEDPVGFLERAEIERGGVELPLNVDLGRTRNELALALARAWQDLTPEEEARLKELLSDRMNPGRDG